MKIACVIDSLCLGGAQQAISTLSNRWQQDHDVTLVTLSADASDYFPLHPRILRIGLAIPSTDSSRWVRVQRIAARIVKLRAAIRSSRADCVVSFGAKTNLLTLLSVAGLRVPVVISDRTDPRRERMNLPMRCVRKFLYRNASRMVIQSEKLRPWATTFLPNEQIEAIGNPLRPEFGSRRESSEIFENVAIQRALAESTSAPATLPTRTARRLKSTPTRASELFPNLDLSNDSADDSGGASATSNFKIVGLGRLHPDKGFDLLIDAFSSIAPRFPEWTLEIWGAGEQRNKLVQLAARYQLADRIRTPGETRTPRSVLESADLFVLPSRLEGFPNALLEAMACGLPCVATDCGPGIRDLISHGESGLVVQSESPEALADSMETCMRNQCFRERISKAAVNVAEQYHIDTIAGRWCELFASVAESTASGTSDLSTSLDPDRQNLLSAPSPPSRDLASPVDCETWPRRVA